MNLVVYADFVCPFCYLAEPILERVVAQTGVTVERRAYELRPAPLPLPDMERGYYRSTFEQSVQPIADALGLEMRFPAVAPRTRKAHEAARFARGRGEGEAMHRAIYRAYFAEGRDIGRIDVLADIASGLGIDAMDMKMALDLDQHTDEVVAEEQEAVDLGVTGVPCFRLGDELLLGVQPPDVLRAFIESGG